MEFLTNTAGALLLTVILLSALICILLESLSNGYRDILITFAATIILFVCFINLSDGSLAFIAMASGILLIGILSTRRFFQQRSGLMTAGLLLYLGATGLFIFRCIMSSYLE